MADDDLRSLERNLLEHPTDPTARRALIQALARTGDTHREFLEWVRLARMGDAEARDTVLWWGGHHGHFSRHALPTKLKVVVRGIVMGRDIHGFAGATRSALIVPGQDIYLLDPLTLEPCGMIPTDPPDDDPDAVLRVEPWGDDVLVGRGREIALHDAQGELLERKKLDLPLSRLEVVGDRVFALTQEDDDTSVLLVLDPAEGFRCIFSRRFTDPDMPTVVGDELVNFRGDETGLAEGTSEILDPATGEVRMSLRGDVVAVRDGRFLATLRHDFLCEYDGPDRAPLWRVQRPEPDWGIQSIFIDPVLATEKIALVPWSPRVPRPGRPAFIKQADDTRLRLVAHDRADGHELWSRTIPHLSKCLVAGELVVAVAYHPHLVVEVLSLATGSEVQRLEFKDFAPDARGMGAAGMLPVPGGLVLLASSSDLPVPNVVRLG